MPNNQLPTVYAKLFNASLWFKTINKVSHRPLTRKNMSCTCKLILK